MKRRLAGVVLAVLMLSPAFAQEKPNLQLFAPANVRPYGSGAEPNEGYFFVFNGMVWTISTPEVTTVGNPTDDKPIVYDVGNDTTGWTLDNSLTTDPFRWKATNGWRADLGRVEGHNGWIFSSYWMHQQPQTFTSTDVHMVFADNPLWRFPPLGDYPPGSGNPRGGRLVGPVTVDANGDFGPVVNLPVFFDQVTIRNYVNNWNVELMYIHRLHPFHRGGVMEFFGGVRYLEFDDLFDVNATVTPSTPADDTTTPPTPAVLSPEDLQRVILGDTYIQTKANNRIVGPQLGGRWFLKEGRWMVTTEGRFFAGFNSQAIRQFGMLGSNLDPIFANRGVGVPDLMLATEFEHGAHFSEWSPAVELRAEVAFQLTKAVSFRTGWTGIWMDGIARSADMVDYTLHEQDVMGILAANNRQDVFMNAWTIGFDINR